MSFLKTISACRAILMISAWVSLLLFAHAGPNIILFIADDHGDRDLGCYGHPTIKTPNIDQLAADGAIFTAAFLSTSSCSPSRCSILTGRPPHLTGAEDLHQPLPADQWSLSRYLKQAGYFTASVGKWHLGAEEKANWSRVLECQAPDMPPTMKQLIRDRPKDRPFFFWIASIDPHRPYSSGTIESPHRPEEVEIPPYLPDHPLIRRDMASYYDEVSRFDQLVGTVKTALINDGSWDDTLVIYLSDNGMPFPRAKTTLYDSGIRTPFLIKWSGVIQPGTKIEHLVSTVDLAPTLLDIADISQSTMTGISFLKTLRQPNHPHRSAVFAEANWHDYEKFTRAVRSARYKLIRNYYWDVPLWNSVDSINSITWQGYLEMREANRLSTAQSFLFQPTRPYEELYDTRRDPSEVQNRIDDPSLQAIRDDLRRQLDNWRVDTFDQMPVERTPDGWTREGNPLPHNQPWYDRWVQQGKKNSFEKF